MDKAVGGKEAAGEKLKAKSGWNDHKGKSGNGTDEFEFSALPGGLGGSDGRFDNVGNNGRWWSADEYKNYYAYNGNNSHYAYSKNMLHYREDAHWTGYSKDYLSSVRCLQDYSVILAQPLAQPLTQPVSATEQAVEITTAITDSRDGKKYKTVKIGSQTWMAENLNYNASGSKCYNNKPANCEKYGRLYEWGTAKKACPSGWHLPSKSEWEELDNAIGGKEVAGKNLKAKSGWNDYIGKSGNGTDEFGFSALPGGLGNSNGSFDNVGDYGYWWGVFGDSNFAYYRNMIYAYEHAYWDYLASNDLFSVRCVKD